jgi:hypothetical protein
LRIRNVLKVIPVLVLVYFISASTLSAQGQFELSFHYSRWNIDILGNIIEDAISDALANELEDTISTDIKDEYDLDLISYSQEVDFDSSGHNYGFEIRWYPGGQYGSFSIGLSVEKTSMKVGLKEIYTDLELSDNSSFQGTAAGDFLIEPLSFHLSFRWDIMPYSRIHPYITFGVGAASFSSFEDDEVTYSYSGVLERPGFEPETETGGETKTIKQIRDDLEEEDEDFLPLPFLPFIQLNLGLKGKITDNIHLMVDAGIWNGFMLRGGIAIRL